MLDIVTAVPLQCLSSNHAIWYDSTRDVSNGLNYYSDAGLTPGWVRFMDSGNVSAFLPDYVTGFRLCCTVYTGWLSTAHPTVPGSHTKIILGFV
jgi:hypothetical protein